MSRAIRTQQDIDELRDVISWSDAFIREIALISPSFVDPSDGSLVAPDALPSLRLVIVTQEDDTPGVELLFDQVRRLVLDFDSDLEFDGYMESGEVFIRLTPGTRRIVAAALKWEIVEASECWGQSSRRL